MILRQANSGAIIRATRDGDALVWNASLGEWFPGPVGGSPPSSVRFVDHAAADDTGNGSIGSPFKTITAAVASLGVAPATGLVIATPGDYSGEGTIAMGGVSLQGWGPAGDRTLGVAVAALSFTGGGSVAIENVACAGNITFPSGGVLELSVLSSDVFGTVGDAADAVNVAQVLSWQNSAFGGDVSFTGACNFTYCETVNAPAVQCLSGITAATQISFFDCPLLNVSALGWPNAGGESPDGIVLCDGASAQQILGRGPTTFGVTQAPAVLTKAIVVVVDSAQTLIQRVTVPAVLAGDVAYVDLDVTGSVIEGVDVGVPIICNPNVDLVAAGAGGGFLNARGSAPNTVRLAFVGPLAGGDALFTFARA